MIEIACKIPWRVLTARLVFFKALKIKIARKKGKVKIDEAGDYKSSFLNFRFNFVVRMM